MLKRKCSETDVSSKIFLDNLCILFSLLATLVNSFSCTFGIVDVTVDFFFVFFWTNKKNLRQGFAFGISCRFKFDGVWCLKWKFLLRGPTLIFIGYVLKIFNNYR